MRELIAGWQRARLWFPPVAGYSGTPLPKKLGIAEASVIAFEGAPEGFRRVLGALPESVEVRKTARGRRDVIVGFVTDRAALGLVDNKVCAIDETWSGLRLVWRRELREGPIPGS